jgi:ABC-2 type transport system permease protein
MTTTPTRELPAASRSKDHYRFSGMLGSEWTKLTTVRSTMWTLLATAVVGVGLGAIVTSAQAARWTDRTLAAQKAFDPTRSSLSGLLFAQLAIGVLGVLVISAEYSTGTIRATFSAVPRRPLVLVAKVVVFGAVTLIVGEIVSFVAFFIGQGILDGKTPTAALSDPGVLRAVISGGLYLLALGLLAMGLASIIRVTAASISTFVGVLFILPIITDVLPSSYTSDINRFLPATIGTVMMSGHYTGSDPFGPWASFALLAGYAAIALLAGGVLLRRRDA